LRIERRAFFALFAFERRAKRRFALRFAINHHLSLVMIANKWGKLIQQKYPKILKIKMPFFLGVHP